MHPQPSRPRGTGSLVERVARTGARSWYARWYDTNGERRKASLGPVRQKGSPVGLTRTEAEAELRRRMSETRPADPRVTPASVPLTIRGVGELVSAQQRRLGRAEGTQYLFALYLRVHLEPYFGERPLSAIDTDTVDAFIADRLARGLKPKTVKNLRAALAQILGYAVSKGWLARNPTQGAEMPQISTTGAIRFLEAEQVLALAEHGPPRDDADERSRLLACEVEHDLYLLAAWSGLRQGELLGLAVRHVDLAAMRIRVERQLLAGGRFTPTKGVLMRSVPLGSAAAQLLARRIQRLGDQPDQLLFAAPEDGSPLSRHRIGGERFKRACLRASVPAITFHELRHTFGTQMIRAGADVRSLQEWMGHKQLVTTQVYLHYAERPGETALVDRAFAAPAELLAAYQEQAG